MFATQCACGTMQHATTWVCKRVAQSAAETHVFGWIGRAPNASSIIFPFTLYWFEIMLHVSSILPEFHHS